MFKVGDEVEVYSEDREKWCFGTIRLTDDSSIPYAVNYPEAPDNSGWYWHRAEEVRAVQSAPAEIWQFKPRSSDEWTDLNESLDGITVSFPSFAGEVNITFRRKPERTAEEIVAEMKRRYDALVWPEIGKILRGDF